MAAGPLIERAERAGVRDPRVLAALAGLDRARFVPAAYGDRAHVDEPIPIINGQFTSQPSLIALMVEALGLTGDERVLEVGTGFGFQTALLAALAREVVSIERDPAIARHARRNLDAAGMRNVRVLTGDGTEGVPGEDPFDAVVVSAAAPAVPPRLAGQVSPGGCLLQPVGPGGHESVTLFRRDEEALRAVRVVSGARFVPLRAGRLPEAPLT